MTTPPPVTSHAAPATWWSRIADVLHRMIVKHRPQMLRRPGTGAHSYRWTPDAPMTMARTLTATVRTERERLADGHALLRAECERMALLLGGIRRGRAERAVRVLHRSATQARTRFTASTQRATGHIRTAARETAAVAAIAARQVGAHRHVKGVNDAAHSLAAQALATLKAYERTRAVGENSPWTTPRGLPA